MVRVKLKKKPPAEEAVDAPCNARLSPDLINSFCALIRDGMPSDAICDYLGINSRVYWTWMRKGQLYNDGGGSTVKGDALYGMFVRACRKAHADYRRGLVMDLHCQQDKDSWGRALAILERRDRRNFSKKEPAGGTDEDYEADDRFL